MELTESIESINTQLRDLYGIDTVTGDPMYRVVFSDEQFETRKMTTTPEGLHLLSPEIRQVPKYRQWIQGKYILENLVQVPDIHWDELGKKISYEPLWTFEDDNGNPLPPAVWACQFVIDTVRAAIGKSSLAKYKDPDKEPDAQIRRVAKLEEELFGDESNLLGRTITGEAIIVPQMPDKEQ